ncbi:hypothetical protein FRC18_002255 [Serendipita sp. 400]|nr:hypothetical protein FRC18_002255 [Serendipita sp. 400]
MSGYHVDTILGSSRVYWTPWPLATTERLSLREYDGRGPRRASEATANCKRKRKRLGLDPAIATTYYVTLAFSLPDANVGKRRQTAKTCPQFRRRPKNNDARS